MIEFNDEKLECIYWLVAQYHVDRDNRIIDVDVGALEHAVGILKDAGLAHGAHYGCMVLKPYNEV